MALPEARDADFFGFRRRPSGVAAEYVKIINDTALRSRLIDAGIAEGLQSPKGPQRIPSIVRLYPQFDAPSKGAKPSPGRVQNGRSGADTPRAAYGLPSVEELQALLARIQSVEAAVSDELQGEINAQIAKLKREIGSLEGDDFERAFRELDRALRARRELSAQVRERAFSQIDGDASFEPRKYLRLIAREPKTL